MISSESISVVLTVENAQNWIAADLEALIDCLADLTSRFEVIVIDNGSRDDTIEILEDLHCRFPQIACRRLARAEAFEDATAHGLALAHGEFIFTTGQEARVAVEELRRLWALRGDRRLLVARSRTTARRIDPGLINRLANWAHRVAPQLEPATAAVENWGGLQMLRREAVEQLRPILSSKQLQASDQPEIEIAHLSHQQLASPKLADARRRASSSSATS
jgi:glycosyltransferase involved in cell wall biosynthesis